MLLLIAYGNPLRRDDGAGLLLADQLEAALSAAGFGVRRLTVQQLMPELAADIAAPDTDAVVFADARPADDGDDGVRLHALGPYDATPALGHHLLPATVLTYAGRLFGRCPPAWALTVPGVDFGYGDQISPAALTALERASQAFAALIEALPCQK